jgi:hypothetical protein
MKKKSIFFVKIFFNPFFSLQNRIELEIGTKPETALTGDPL